MTKTYMVSENVFTALDNGTQSFEFMEVDEQPVAIVNVNDHDHNQLMVTIEPVNQVPQDFPSKIIIEKGYMNEVFSITDEKQILKLLLTTLRRTIGSTNTSKRDNRLMGAYITALDTMVQ